MIADLPPGLILILGALGVPFVPRWVRRYYLLALPALGLLQLFMLPAGVSAQVEMFGHTLTFLRIDGLSFAFGVVFLIAALLAVIYGWHEEETLQHVAALIYGGAAIGAVFVADLISLFIFWELTAIASVFLIWARRTERAYWAGLRYLVIQIGSGVILLAGVVLHYRVTGSIAFEHLGVVSFATALIFLAFGIKCAFPLLHNWLQDSYPEATVMGTVVLSAFTTKMAVYALARGFAGTDMLIWIGAAMTVFPIFYAIIENDLRRVLAYSLNIQLGFMVTAIGIGTELAINGAVAHAFTHVLYKALLFMSMGAVLHRLGTVKATELGGLFRSMPLTAGLCIVGTASIAAVPLFSGFVSKSLILASIAAEGQWLPWLMLLVASAGVVPYTAYKVPYTAFFAKDSGKRCKEAPTGMLLAMTVTAALCIGIGLWPAGLYPLLPYPVDYQPYTVSHVVTQLQLLMFSALAVAVLMRNRLFPQNAAATNLDTDWLYRRMCPALLKFLGNIVRQMHLRALLRAQVRLVRFIETIYRHHGPQGALARTWPAGSTVLWVAILLCVTLIFYYV
ncbi:MAG: Na(+)/H(+) antiporter subunit D [Alphaproteobacteria bacterium]|nr:Na(+)/H(+) antiporter subunit D [Alphaproteobacteria bacterium]